MNADLSRAGAAAVIGVHPWPRIAGFLLRVGDAGLVKYDYARRTALPLAAVATGFALLAADLASAPGLGHAGLLSTL
jgi:hypothetical protein